MIPNIIHFVFGLSPDFGGKPFSLIHYLAIRSALAVNKPDKIYFHYEYEPSGEWWKKIKPCLELNRIKAPKEIFGNPLIHTAHKSDVVNLQMLQRYGGIYLDMDTICIKPYGDLLQNKVVMGLERKPVFYYPGERRRYMIRRALTWPFTRMRAPGIKGLGNSVIMAEPGSAYIGLWLDAYRTFRSRELFDEYWNEHSVRIPYQIARDNPDLITLLEADAFCIPYYDQKGLELLFRKVHEFRGAYVFHLWESISWKDFCAGMTPSAILSNDSTYNRLARKYL